MYVLTKMRGHRINSTTAVPRLPLTWPHVLFSVLPFKGPLTEETIEAGGYAAVLLVDETVGFQLRANEACRRAGTAFVSASSRGAFASLFCDFGNSFVVQDTDGEEALVRLTPAERTP